MVKDCICAGLVDVSGKNRRGGDLVEGRRTEEERMNFPMEIGSQPICSTMLRMISTGRSMVGLPDGGIRATSDDLERLEGCKVVSKSREVMRSSIWASGVLGSGDALCALQSMSKR